MSQQSSQSPQPQPQSTSQPQPQSQPRASILEIQWGNVVAKVYRKRVLACIAVVGAVSFLFKKEIKSWIDRQNDTEPYVQYDNYKAIHPQVNDIISSWNKVHSVEDTLRDDVRKILRTIYGIHSRFSTLKVDKLSISTQIYWHMDNARLNNILYDIHGDEKYAEEAIKFVNEAKRLSSDASKMNDNDLKNLHEHNVDYEIDWIQIASFTLTISNGNGLYKAELEKLIAKYGGCDMFKTDPVTHFKMREGLPCAA